MDGTGRGAGVGRGGGVTPPSKPKLGSTFDASRLKFCRNVIRGVAAATGKCSESSLLSLTTARSSMNAALGVVSARGTGTPLFKVTHSGGGPSALVANQSVGNAGGVRLSKLSLNVTRPEHGGHGPPPESCATVGATATPAMSNSNKTTLRSHVSVSMCFRFLIDRTDIRTMFF